MPVVKADALTEGNNNRWNLILPAWVNADTRRAAYRIEYLESADDTGKMKKATSRTLVS
ncbi:intimin [Salmonella bongori]|nr:intimin [Salmonella bongori]